MITFATQEEFNKHTIARVDDPGSYENSGWIIVVDGDFAAITSFGHCSCYGTWSAIHDRRGEIAWTWSGTVEELRVIITQNRDPHFPTKGFLDREGAYDSSDKRDLEEAYKIARQWFYDNKPLPYSYGRIGD